MIKTGSIISVEILEKNKNSTRILIGEVVNFLRIDRLELYCGEENGVIILDPDCFTGNSQQVKCTKLDDL